MKTIIRPGRSRAYWLMIALLLLVAVSAGSYWWYGQGVVKYDRITNAKRV